MYSLFFKDININNILDANPYNTQLDLNNNNYIFNKIGDLILEGKFKSDSKNDDKKLLSIITRFVCLDIL